MKYFKTFTLAALLFLVTPFAFAQDAEAEKMTVMEEQSASVAATNLKTLGDAPAFFQAQAYAESIANTQSMNQLRMTLLGKISESIIATTPSEAAGSVAMAGILIKAMQTTPPLTAGQTVAGQE